MAEDFNTLRFHLVDGLERRVDGDVVRLKEPRRATYLAVTHDQWDILSRFDGKRQVGDILLEELRASQSPNIEVFYRLVVAARNAGMLVPPGHEPSGPDWRERATPAGECKVGFLRFNTAAAAVIILLGLGTAVLRPVELPSTVLGWLVCLFLMPCCLTMAAIWKLRALKDAGRQGYGAGLGFVFGCPALTVDARDAFMGGRFVEASVALQSLGAPFFWLCLLALVSGGLAPGAFAALVACFMLTCPARGTPGHQFVAALFSRSSLLPRLAGEFLPRRLIHDLLASRRDPGTQEYLVACAVHATLWLGCLLWTAGTIIRTQGDLLLRNALLADSAWVALPSLVSCGLLVVLVVAPLLLQLRVLVRNGVLLAQRLFPAEKRVQARARVSSWGESRIREFLRQTLLFRDVDEETLGLLAASVECMELVADTVVTRQDDPGDALFVVCHGEVEVRKTTPDGEVTVVAVLGPGDVFGEIVLLDRVPRTATVVALGDVELLSLGRQAFEQTVVPTLGGEEVRLRIQIAAFLGRHDLFGAWQDADLMRVAHQFDLREIGAGDILIREGSEYRHFYIVYEGEMAVARQGNSLGTLRQGDIIGEVSLLKRLPAIATVTAIGPVRLLRLPESAFASFLSLDPRAALMVEETATFRLHQGGAG